MAYDDPSATITREIHTGTLTGVASAAITKYKLFQKATLKKVHTTIDTAGTNAAAGFDIYVGTTSVGAVTLGTNTAGTEVASSTLNAAVPAGGVIELRGKANSATMKFTASLEYDVAHDAEATA